MALETRVSFSQSCSLEMCKQGGRPACHITALLVGLCVPERENETVASCKSQEAAVPASRLVRDTPEGLPDTALPPRESGGYSPTESWPLSHGE